MSDIKERDNSQLDQSYVMLGDARSSINGDMGDCSRNTNDIAVISKPESKRVESIASQLNKTIDNMQQLITDKDESYETIRLFSKNLSNMLSIITTGNGGECGLIDFILSSMDSSKSVALKLKDIVPAEAISTVVNLLRGITDCTYIIKGISQLILEDNSYENDNSF